MQNNVHLRVDPKLAHALSKNYSFSEKAFKELIDNSWDAEATVVPATVPSSPTVPPIIVQDNGSGMKTVEVETEYLNIASPRLSRKGDRTPDLNRIVKSRKRIGKFVGLILASEMELVTHATGRRTAINVSKPLLMATMEDQEKVPLPLAVVDSDPPNAHDNTITLRNLNPKHSHIKPDKLKELLALDYGSETTFVIFVNGARVFHHNIPSSLTNTRARRPRTVIATAKTQLKWMISLLITI